MNKSGGDFYRFCVRRAALAADGHRDGVWARVQEEGKTLAISSIICLQQKPTNWEMRKELKAQREVLLLLPRSRKSHERDCDVPLGGESVYWNWRSDSNDWLIINTLRVWPSHISHEHRSLDIEKSREKICNICGQIFVCLSLRFISKNQFLLRGYIGHAVCLLLNTEQQGNCLFADFVLFCGQLFSKTDQNTLTVESDTHLKELVHKSHLFVN